MDTATTKICSYCSYDLSLDSFYRDTKGKYGRSTVCRDCNRIKCAKYRQENLEALKEKARIKREANPQAIKDWRAANRDRVRDYNEYKYYQNPEYYREAGLIWRKKNPQRSKELWNNWVERNPYALAEKQARATAAKYGVRSEPLDLPKVWIWCQGVCYWCNLPLFFEDRSLEHFMPMSKGGANIDSNVSFVHISCNIKKSTSMPNTTQVLRFLNQRKIK